MSDDRFVGTRAVAARLGVSQPTACRLMATGQIRAVRIGGRLKSRIRWVEEYLRRAEVRPGEGVPSRTGARAAHLEAVKRLRERGIG